MQHLDSYFLFFIAFLSAVIFIPFIANMALKKGFLENRNERKRHSEKASSLGGLAIYFATAIALASVTSPALADTILIFALAFPLLLIGVFDDVIGISISSRIVMHLLLGVLVFEMGFQFFDGYNWLFNLGATVFFVAVLINAYNFIDGINGLAGGLGLLASLGLSVLLLKNGNTNMAILGLAYAGSIAGFLVYNFRNQAKIFMGDNGSTVMGLLISIMVLAVLKQESVSNAKTPLPLLFALIAIPVFDLFKVILFRVCRGRSPICPDRSHIHHLLVDNGVSHPIASLTLILYSGLTIVLAWAFPHFFGWPNLLLLMALPYPIIWLVKNSQKDKKSKAEEMSLTDHLNLKELLN